MVNAEQDYQALRLRMVAEQVEGRGIKDPAVLAALRTVPREVFVPEAFRPYAYEDRPLPIPAGQTISQPYVVAYMLNALQLKPGDRVLEVGTGSGYTAAALSRIAGQVYSIERWPLLVGYAQERLARLGYDNVFVFQGNGSLGWPERAPYAAIMVAAGGLTIPAQLRRQLAVGGCLLMPLGALRRQQTLVRMTRRDEYRFETEDLGVVAFVPLVAASGGGAEECRADDVPSPAGMGVRLRAETPARLFACAGEALFNRIDSPTAVDQPTAQRTIVVEAADATQLLVAWLTELLDLYRTTGEVYSHCHIVAWEPTRLQAIVAGYHTVRPPMVHVAGVAPGRARVFEEDGRWLAQLFFRLRDPAGEEVPDPTAGRESVNEVRFRP